MSPTGIDAVGRQALVLGLQIGSGKTKARTSAGALAHDTKKRKRAAEHLCGVG